MVFPDAGEAFTIHVRRGVAEIRKRAGGTVGDEQFDLHIVADADAWKQMLARVSNPVAAMAGFHYKKGNLLTFARFMMLFEPPRAKLPFESLSRAQ